MSRKIYDISPSGMGYITNCAGRYGLLKENEQEIIAAKLLSPDDDTASHRGTAAHRVVELVLMRVIKSGFKIKFKDALKELQNKYGNIHINIDVEDSIRGICALEVVLLVDEDMPAILTMLYYIASLIKSHPMADLHSEMWLRKIFKHPLARGGTVDVSMQDAHTLIVVDYKHGVVPVDVNNNVQLLAYAIGLCRRYNWKHKRVKMVIVQPRAYASPIKEWEISTKKLSKIKKGLERSIQHVDDLYQSGEYINELNMHDACGYCDANFICPERRKVFKKALGIATDNKGLKVDDYDFPIKPKDLRFILDNGEALIKFIKDTRGYSLNLISKRGTNIPNWKVVKSRVNRRYRPKAVNILTEACVRSKIDPSILFKERQLVAQTELKKVLGVKFVDKALMTPSSSGLSLVSSSDNRQAVSLKDTLKLLKD